MNNDKMRAIMSRINSQEKKAALSIAAMVALRIYGLFLIMPVFSVYAEKLPSATPILIGLAVGVYGLTQAILQVPMGLLSDFWGRKKVLAVGLTMFLLGSILAALAKDIHWIIIGRCVQGMGAIASTGMAYIADVSRPEQRGKMMGIVGGSIGLAFMLSFISGPLLAQWLSISGLFWLTAGLACLALFLLFLTIEEPRQKVNKSFSVNDMLMVIKQKELLLLDMFIFLLHASMTAIFVVLPLILVHQLQLPTQQHWQFYLPILLCSLAIMIPMIIQQEKGQRHVSYMLVAMLFLSLTILSLIWAVANILILAVLMTLYFGLFNFLEAAMPAMLSKRADEAYRGAAMGVFSSLEFLGAFVGGLMAGVLMQWQKTDVFLFLFIMLFGCTLLAFRVFRKSN